MGLHSTDHKWNTFLQQGPPGDQQGQNPATSGAPTSGGAPATGGQGQPDYSAAWAMYYQQMYQQQAAAAAGQPAGGNAAQGEGDM